MRLDVSNRNYLVSASGDGAKSFTSVACLQKIPVASWLLFEINSYDILIP